MKTRIIIFLLALLSAAAASAAVPAREAVACIARNLTDSRSATVRYTPSADGDTQPSQIICIMGDKFKINSKEMAVWYDGKTQWTYIAHNKEVNITEPTPEELAEINPLLILGTLQSHYQAAYLKSDSQNPILELTPKNGSEGALPITKLIIKYNATDYSPIDLKVEFDAGNSLDIHVTSVTKGINYPPSTFVFKKELLPGAEIVDLR